MRPAVLCLVFAVGCLDEGKGPEEELLDDSKADSHRRPTDHGTIELDVPAFSALTTDERYHAWSFELSGDASVTMTTSYAIRGQRRVDTVLYLYKEGPNGWGSYVARNDDYGTTIYSQLVRDLDRGRYRVLVKGHSAATLGKFKITVGCDGPGCAPANPDACVFGETYRDIPTAPALETIHARVITVATLPELSAADQQKLVLAVQQSSHTDVTTPEEALSRVDQQEINVTFIAEPAAQRTFIAFEYGAGDNSYGAIFERASGAMVTNIHDGDLENCTVKAEQCLLSDDWLAMRSDPAFTRTSSRVVTAAAQLNALETEQALAVFRHSFEDVTSVSDGLSRVDGNLLNIVGFVHAATGTRLTVLEYGAGDTSVGGIMYEGTTQLAGRINDLAIEGCTLFAE